MAWLRWLCVVVLVGAAAPLARGQVALEWKLKKGDTFYVESSSSFKQSVKVLDKGIEARQEANYTAVFRYTVEEKGEDNTLVLEQRLEGLRIAQPGTQTVIPDAKLKGVVLRLMLNPKREVVKIEKRADLIKALAGDDATVQKALETILSEEALKRSVSELFAFVPDKPAKSWQRESQRSLGPLGSLSVVNKYTHEGKESALGKSAERIRLTSAVTYRLPADKEAKAGPFRVLASKPQPVPASALSGLLGAPAAFADAADGLTVREAKGTIYFDADAGRLVAAVTSLKLRGPLTISLSGTALETYVEQEMASRLRVHDRNPIKK